MSVDDRRKWDAIWGAIAVEEVPEPKPLFVELDGVLPREGRALDVAGGAGANAIWLAERGMDVTLTDISGVALGHANAASSLAGVELNTLQLDFEHDRLPPGPWDLIVCVYYIDRRLYPVYPYLLAPGGLLVLAHPTKTNLERHDHPSARYLLEPGELPDLVPTLEVVHSSEGWTPDGFHEAHFVGRRVGW